MNIMEEEEGVSTAVRLDRTNDPLTGRTSATGPSRPPQTKVL